MKTTAVRIGDIKSALLDHKFRQTLPEELFVEVSEFLKNPGCQCNTGLYRKILATCGKQLADYFPLKEVPKDLPPVKNIWTVINCTIDQLEEKLRALPPGKKSLALARSGNDVTVVINELELD